MCVNKEAKHISVSLGYIDEMKINKNGFVKYKVLYKSNGGKNRTLWTDWMENEGYSVGDSIPVHAREFAGVSKPISVNQNPQRSDSPYVFAMVIATVGAFVTGYVMAKNEDCIKKSCVSKIKNISNSLL